ELAAEIGARRTNESYLPGVVLPPAVTVSADLAEVVRGAAMTVLAVPTQRLRGLLETHREAPWPSAPIAIACKGIEVGTRALPSRIVEETLGEAAGGRVVVLSGPSFAAELAAGEPTAVVAASADREAAGAVQRRLSLRNLRVYTSSDPLGVQLAAALKNVVAIAAGIADGLGHGSNTAAALITRSLAEIARLGVALGARRETFAGLAGVGDLVLTCTGGLSRNRHVGRELGRGRSLADVLGEMQMVAEGVETSRAARELAAEAGVEMPIVEQVHAVLFRGKAPADALRELLSRPLKAEDEEAPSP
ncbi:MAG: NAD(P)-dependent glycerol-3-phosphate dehydrogenase, partial [Acidobacteria bacterium]